MSIDGWGVDWYPVIQQHPEQYPTLFRLLREGTRAQRMTGVFPTLTYPSHATIVTGAWPSQHGISSNYDREGAWVLRANQLAAVPIWKAAAAQSLSTALVNWPISYGAEVDYLIPQNLDFHATDLADQVRRHSTPGLFESLEATVGEVVMLPFLHHDAGYYLDSMTGRFAVELIRRYQPRLLLVHFLDLDHRQHMDGTLAPEAKVALLRIDEWIAGLLDAIAEVGIAESTAVFVLGDHGFANVDTAVCLPRLLEAAGLPLPSSSSPGEGPLEMWMARASVALRADPDLHAEESLVRTIGEQLPAIVTVLDRQELDAQNAFPDADFALVAATGYIFATSSCEKLLGSSGIFRGAHGYLPDEPAMAAGFLAAGAGIKSGEVLPLVRMVDVAPTIARLLGMRFEVPAGRVVEELLLTDRK